MKYVTINIRDLKIGDSVVNHGIVKNIIEWAGFYCIEFHPVEVSKLCIRQYGYIVITQA